MNYNQLLKEQYKSDINYLFIKSNKAKGKYAACLPFINKPDESSSGNINNIDNKEHINLKHQEDNNISDRLSDRTDNYFSKSNSISINYNFNNDTPLKHSLKKINNINNINQNKNNINNIRCENKKNHSKTNCNIDDVNDNNNNTNNIFNYLKKKEKNIMIKESYNSIFKKNYSISNCEFILSYFL